MLFVVVRVEKDHFKERQLEMGEQIRTASMALHAAGFHVTPVEALNRAFRCSGSFKTEVSGEEEYAFEFFGIVKSLAYDSLNNILTLEASGHAFGNKKFVSIDFICEEGVWQLNAGKKYLEPPVSVELR